MHIICFLCKLCYRIESDLFFLFDSSANVIYVLIIKGIAQDFTSFLSYHKQANLASGRTWLNDFVVLSCKLLLDTFLLRGTISRLFLQFVSFVV